MNVDPVRRALDNAPLDDEPETEEERRTAEGAEADFKADRTISTDEIKKELGIQEHQLIANNESGDENGQR